MTHPPGTPPSDPAPTQPTGPGRTSLRTEPKPEPGMPVPHPDGPPKPQAG